MSDYEVKQVIVVRRDLNMRKGKIAAQVAHASMKAILDCSTLINDQYIIPMEKGSPIQKWLSGLFTKIVVGCDSLEEIDNIEKQCIEKGVIFARIIDSGLTEFNGIPTDTCIAVGPGPKNIIDEITGELKCI